MPSAADLEERTIWQLEQAGYAVTIHADHRYTVIDPTGRPIATPASLDELRRLAEQFSKLVWLGYQRVMTA